MKSRNLEAHLIKVTNEMHSNVTYGSCVIKFHREISKKKGKKVKMTWNGKMGDNEICEVTQKKHNYL